LGSLHITSVNTGDVAGSVGLGLFIVSEDY